MGIAIAIVFTSANLALGATGLQSAGDGNENNVFIAVLGVIVVNWFFCQAVPIREILLKK